MKNTPRRISLTDISRETGFSRATVSMALRDDPRLAQKTRDLIQAVAKELKYKPNPHLAKVLAETVRTRYENRGAVLAFLATRDVRDGWRMDRTLGFDAVCRRAAEYGFQVEFFPIQDCGAAPEKLNKLLWARGVAGLLISPLNYEMMTTGKRTLPIEWDNFAAVEIDDTMIYPILNRVRHNHLSGMWKALDALEALGYRRIGLCLTSEVDLATHHRWNAGYLLWRTIRGFDGDLYPFLAKNLEAEPLHRWLQQQRIDAVMSPGTNVWNLLRESGIDVPGEVGFASLDAWGPGAEQVSGIDQRRDLMSGMAVDMLVTLINRNIKGVPEHPTNWTYSGDWQEGLTTRRLASPPPAMRIEEFSLDAFPVWPALKSERTASAKVEV